MALNSALVRVPGTGEISLAPPGTPEPPDAATPLSAAWRGLGLSTRDGVTLARKVEKEGTEHWQQITPARFIYKSQELTVKSAFQETKAAVLDAYFGGLTFTETAAGSKKYRAEISSIPKDDVRALCVDWIDRISATEIYHHRLFIPRADVSETDDAQWSGQQEARWGMTFVALAPVGGSTVLAAWLTDDPAVIDTTTTTPAPAASGNTSRTGASA
ncbi:phage tail tube protein [Actinokineospora iranica]|uniref:Phage major tail protein, phi13 family n=1 Tax=Actinokineospora iranica TaxID=1271860 RepID=A0A1G6K682_9PSEU|nr:phage tail protein [Actinokineospora iranica]SDC25816.1 hypothetical protein SAMN05216174_101708 [Actinokineospora iranica]